MAPVVRAFKKRGEDGSTTEESGLRVEIGSDLSQAPRWGFQHRRAFPDCGQPGKRIVVIEKHQYMI